MSNGEDGKRLLEWGFMMISCDVMKVGKGERGYVN